MSTLVVEQPTLEGLGAEPTLDDLVAGTWVRLSAHQLAECPACHGQMEPEYGAQALQLDDSGAAQTSEAGGRAGRKPEAGRCTDCGTVLG